MDRLPTQAHISLRTEFQFINQMPQYQPSVQIQFNTLSLPDGEEKNRSKLCLAIGSQYLQAKLSISLFKRGFATHINQSMEQSKLFQSALLPQLVVEAIPVLIYQLHNKKNYHLIKDTENDLCFLLTLKVQLFYLRCLSLQTAMTD